MKLKALLASTAALITTFLLPTQALAQAPPAPAADQETPFYDRHKIDISKDRKSVV